MWNSTFENISTSVDLGTSLDFKSKILLVKLIILKINFTLVSLEEFTTSSILNILNDITQFIRTNNLGTFLVIERRQWIMQLYKEDIALLSIHQQPFNQLHSMIK